MAQSNLLNIINILQALLNILIYLGAAVAVFFALRKERIHNFFTEIGIIAYIIVFIIGSGLLSNVGLGLVSDLFSIIRGLIIQEGVGLDVVQCLSGFLFLAALVAGSILLVKRPKLGKLD